MIVFVTRVTTLPQTFWQSEELRFARALLTFDPLQQQPEAPAYPLYVAIGRLVNFFVHAPFVSLLTLSVIAATAGACLVGQLAAELLDSDWAGGAAALLLYFSPAMLVFDALPNPEAIAVALIAASFLAMLFERDWWFGALAACAIGVRPEIAFAMIVAVAVTRRVRALIATVVFSVIIFGPVVEAIGASHVVAYAKTNYAALRTSSEAVGLHGRELLLRFFAHPWGSKWMSFPLLLAAVVGVLVIGRRAKILAAFAAAHLLFCFAFADRAGGVQPVVPALLVVAIFAIATFARWPAAAVVVSMIYAIGGFAYAWPILELRRSSPSPPARAMRYARRAIPHDAVLLYDPSLEAWAQFSRFESAPIRDFDRFAGRGVPLFVLADGGSRSRRASVFEWPDSDAYGKVTTERYRVVSLLSFPPETRYRSLGGLYSFERTPDGREWRWVAGDAVIQLPLLRTNIVRLTLALPDDAPIESNSILANGTRLEVARGQTVTIAVGVGRGRLLGIHAARTFSSPRDRRTLAVQLIALEQR